MKPGDAKQAYQAVLSEALDAFWTVVHETFGGNVADAKPEYITKPLREAADKAIDAWIDDEWEKA